MAAPARVPLGPPTLARKWYLDVDTSATSTPTWTPVNGLFDFKAPVDPNLEDVSDFDAEGWGADVKTGGKWKIDAKVRRKATAASATAYDPGQEKIRALADLDGIPNTGHFRWYEMNGTGGPKVEAYEGRGAVAWTDEGGDTKGASNASFTISGQGKRTPITHPDA